MRIKMRMRVMMMMIIIIIIIIICSGKPKIPRPLLYRRLKVRYHKISSGSDIVLCSWARHLTLTAPLFTQVYKWVPAKFNSGGNPAMD